MAWLTPAVESKRAIASNVFFIPKFCCLPFITDAVTLLRLRNTAIGGIQDYRLGSRPEKCPGENPGEEQLINDLYSLNLPLAIAHQKIQRPRSYPANVRRPECARPRWRSLEAWASASRLNRRRRCENRCRC